MKRILGALAVALVLSAFTVQAKDTPVDRAVEIAFKNQFAGAEYVHWEKVSSAFQATFNYMGQRLIAYFSTEGELISTTRYIYANQLPFKVEKELRERFPNAVVQESVLEALYDSETVYFITAKDANKEYLLKANAMGGITVTSKRKLN